MHTVHRRACKENHHIYKHKEISTRKRNRRCSRLVRIMVESVIQVTVTVPALHRRMVTIRKASILTNYRISWKGGIQHVAYNRKFRNFHDQHHHTLSVISLVIIMFFLFVLSCLGIWNLSRGIGEYEFMVSNHPLHTHIHTHTPSTLKLKSYHKTLPGPPTHPDILNFRINLLSYSIGKKSLRSHLSG